MFEVRGLMFDVCIGAPNVARVFKKITSEGMMGSWIPGFQIILSTRSGGTHLRRSYSDGYRNERARIMHVCAPFHFRRSKKIATGSSVHTTSCVPALKAWPLRRIRCSLTAFSCQQARKVAGFQNKL
jgi:hypothetical protein